jgi:hypothetical protein
MQNLPRLSFSNRILNRPKSLKNQVKRMLFFSAHFSSQLNIEKGSQGLICDHVITDQALTPFSFLKIEKMAYIC